MKKHFVLILACLHLCLASPLLADALDQKSFSELAYFIQHQATAKELSGLAQRQFYFEVQADFAQNASDYAEMQEAIAEKIPTEFARPVFDLRFIFGDRRSIKVENTVGILGGTGPISDSNITLLVINQLNSNEFGKSAMIHLFSLPPPRTTKDQILGGALYSARLTRFLRHGYAEYFLASNTAYLNIGTLQTLSGSARINHLPKMIADMIAQDQQQTGPEPILILGTKQAWDRRLYDSIFETKGMPYASPALAEQVELQKWVDRVKQGRLSQNERMQLKYFIAQLGVQLDVKVLLLSCTELPLGLGELMDDLRADGFVVYDSELMIAGIIAGKFEDLAH